MANKTTAPTPGLRQQQSVERWGGWLARTAHEHPLWSHYEKAVAIYLAGDQLLSPSLQKWLPGVQPIATGIGATVAVGYLCLWIIPAAIHVVARWRGGKLVLHLLERVNRVGYLEAQGVRSDDQRSILLRNRLREEGVRHADLLAVAAARQMIRKGAPKI